MKSALLNHLQASQPAKILAGHGGGDSDAPKSPAEGSELNGIDFCLSSALDSIRLLSRWSIKTESNL